MIQLSQDEIKKLLGHQAALLVEDGMLVGLGTGSTASCLIDSLIKRCKEGLKITVVSSSNRSLQQAREGGIPTRDFDTFDIVDLTIDGTDEIDPENRMIKGGGGALVREKILASSSRNLIIMADESKLVSTLGKCPLPVEIIPFGMQATLAKIMAMGYQGSMRKNKQSNSLYITDNGNYIFDIHSPKGFSHPEQDHERLIHQPGVVDTGFFFNLPMRLLVGYRDGSVTFLEGNDG